MTKDDLFIIRQLMKMIKRKSINATSTCIFVVESNFNFEAYFSAPYFIAF